MKKRTLSLILATAMVAGSLVGCEALPQAPAHPLKSLQKRLRQRLLRQKQKLHLQLTALLSSTSTAGTMSSPTE